MSVAAVDPVTRACGPSGARRWFCALVAEHSDSHTAARVAHYLSPWVTALCIVIGALVLTRFVRVVTQRSVRRLPNIRPGTPTSRSLQRAATIGAALSSLAAIVIGIIAIFAVLGAFGVDIGPLLAGAGLAGVILGFGAQNLLRDIIAGGFMIGEDQFGVGDRVDVGVVTGAVEHITLRVTTIRDDDGVVWYVPNGSVTRVANLSQRTPPA